MLVIGGAVQDSGIVGDERARFREEPNQRQEQKDIDVCVGVRESVQE